MSKNSQPRADVIQIYEREYTEFLEFYAEDPHELNAKYGWLSPHGRLVPCRWAGHDRLARLILRHEYGIGGCGENLLKKGWQKLAAGDWSCLGMNYYRVTQPQFDTIVEYCQLHKLKIPDCDIV